MNFSIVIACYNEEKNIKNLLEEIRTILQNYKYEIIFIDDKSTDESIKVISNYLNYNNIKVIRNSKNRGQSFCIYEGAKLSSSKVIVTLDCDGQNNPIDIPKLFEKYINDKEVYLIGGTRSKRKDKFIKIFTSKIANNFRKLILNDNCDDTGCGLKVFDKETFINFPYFDGIHRFLPALFLGIGKKTTFINVDHRQRIFGVSKYGTFKRAIKGIIDIIRVYKIIKNFKSLNV